MIIFQHYRILAMALLVGLIVAFSTNFYCLSNGRVHAKTDEYWKGEVDQKLVQGKERDDAIFTQLKGIRDKIDGVYDNITEIKIQAAKNAVLYGGGSGSAIYVIGLLGKLLVSRKNEKKRNDNA